MSHVCGVGVAAGYSSSLSIKNVACLDKNRTTQSVNTHISIKVFYFLRNQRAHLISISKFVTELSDARVVSRLNDKN